MPISWDPSAGRRGLAAVGANAPQRGPMPAKTNMPIAGVPPPAGAPAPVRDRPFAQSEGAYRAGQGMAAAAPPPRSPPAGGVATPPAGAPPPPRGRGSMPMIPGAGIRPGVGLAAGGIQNNPNAGASPRLAGIGQQLTGQPGLPGPTPQGQLGTPRNMQSSALQQALLNARGQAGLAPAAALPPGGKQLQGGGGPGAGMQVNPGNTSGQQAAPLQRRGAVQQGQTQADQAAAEARSQESDRLQNEPLGPNAGELPTDYAARTAERQRRLMELTIQEAGDPTGSTDAAASDMRGENHTGTDANHDGIRDTAQPGSRGEGTPWGNAANGIVTAVGGDLGNVADNISDADRTSQRKHYGDVEAGWDTLTDNAERLYSKDARAAAEGAARDQMNSDANGQRDAALRMQMGQQARGGQQTSGGSTGIFNNTQANLAKGNRMLTQDAYDREMKSAAAQSDLLNDVNQQKKGYLDDSYTSRQKLLAMMMDSLPDDVSLFGDIG